MNERPDRSDSSASLDPIGGEPDRPDVQNDDVIAVALKRSLLLFVVAAVPLIGLLAYLNFSKPAAEIVEPKVVLPTLRTEAAITAPPIPLVPVTAEQSGIDFVHHSGKAGDKLLPETMGSGVAVLDYNNDDRLDLLFVNSSDWPWSPTDRSGATTRLYRGDGDFRFTDVTDAAGLGVNAYGMGAAVADYDNDGDTDIYLTAVGPNRLLRNDDGVFVDVTDAAGVAGGPDDWSTSTGFFDYDNDGLLDLFVCNYVDWSREEDASQPFTLDGDSRAYGPPRAFAGSFSKLFRGKSDGTFEDVSQRSGIEVRNTATDVPLGKAMGLAPADVNGDGWIDIIVANDTVQNFLFLNREGQRFDEVAASAGIAYDRASGNARGAMGIDAVRFRPTADDANPTLAIGIGNFANEASALYMSRGIGSEDAAPGFIDAAMYTGFGPPSRSSLTFGLFFWDADLDGRFDILGANGHLEEEIQATQSSQTYAQPPQLFWNAGRESSSELTMVRGQCVGDAFCRPIVGRAAAYGDFDNDGDQDVVITVNDGPPSLFRNDQSTEHRSLRIKLTGTTANRDAIGAVVSVTVDGQKFQQTVMPTKSYLSQCELTLTFGLGTAKSIDSVSIVWPGGQAQSIDPSSMTVDEALVSAIDPSQTFRVTQPSLDK